MIDTHTHLYDERFDDVEEVIARACSAGVSAMLQPAVDSSSHGRLIELCRRFPQNCFAMMGLHPTSVNDNDRFSDELDAVEKYLQNPPVKFYAIGETGLDLHWSKDFLEQQTEALRFQLELSLKYSLPVVLHTRDAFDEIIEVISDYSEKGLRGVFHSFSGTVNDYRKIKKLGDFMFGISGVVTYRKSGIALTIKEMELSDLVLETDSPYLPPVPHRGERNESSYVPYITNKIAEIKEISANDVDRITTENAKRMFGLP